MLVAIAAIESPLSNVIVTDNVTINSVSGRPALPNTHRKRS